MKSFKQIVNEVLSKDAKASEWIDDFVNSDNPKFEGKSKEKRKEMALAAYYAKQRNEEVELDEATKPYDQGSWAALKGKSYSENPHPKGSKEHLDWAKGHNATRAHKAQMEKVELDEAKHNYSIYHKTYTDAVQHGLEHHEKQGLKVSEDDRWSKIGVGPKKPSEGKTNSLDIPATHEKTGKKHMIHMQIYNKGGQTPYELNTYSSTHRSMQKEELVSEKYNLPKHDSGKVDARYSIGREHTGSGDKGGSHVVRFADDFVSSHSSKEDAEKAAAAHAAKRQKSLGEGWGAETQRKQADASGKNWDDLLNKHKDHPENHKLLKYMRINNWNATAAENELTGSRPKLSKDKWKEQMAKHEKKFGPIKEDFDLDELLGFNESRGHKILGRAMSRIATRQAVASGEIQPGPKPNETEQEKAKRDLELKNQQKTKAVDEETELDEMSGAGMSALDLHRHLKKNGWSLSRTKGSHDVFTHPSSPKNIAVPRHKGDLKVPTVLQILKTSKVQEETNMISYKEFTEMIEEGKMDDLKDRLAAAREKRLNDYDFSKEKDEPKSNVSKHYADMSDDESNPEEKRGKGRPSGSKSGAR